MRASRPLPPRLSALLARVPFGAALADIACDHALLACEALRTGRARKAIGVDVAAAPLAAAARRIAADGREPIELRRGDGFALQPFEVDVAVVAGIGGERIAALLRRDLPQSLGIHTLLLSPQGDEAAVREALAETGWAVVEEWLVRDGERVYVGLAASPGAVRRLDVAEAECGRLERDAAPPLLAALAADRLARWRREAEALAAAGRHDEAALRRQRAAAWTPMLVAAKAALGSTAPTAALGGPR